MIPPRKKGWGNWKEKQYPEKQKCAIWEVRKWKSRGSSRNLHFGEISGFGDEDLYWFLVDFEHRRIRRNRICERCRRHGVYYPDLLIKYGRMGRGERKLGRNKEGTKQSSWINRALDN